MACGQAIAPEKVAIYIRWSTEDQGEGTTLDVQMEGCRHYLLSQGWQFRPDLVFIDDGCSGASLDRPSLRALREQVLRGEVECVVVYKLDRLSRSVADTARLCMEEWEGICVVKSAREPIDTQTQAGRMFFYTLMNYAEWERSVIRDRTHSGRVRRAQEGRNPGITLPYGYTLDPATGNFALVPHEAVVVRRLFDAYRRGAGLLRIVGDLNQEGIQFRGGRRWRVNTVAYILANPAYTGLLVWGRRMRNPRYKKRGGEPMVTLREEPLVQKAGVFPVIISEADFAEVQQIRQARPQVGRGGGRALSSTYLLTGCLRCAHCGRPMIGQQNDPRRQHGRYYACLTRRDHGPAACAAANIPCHLLDEAVASRLLTLYRTEEARQRCLTTLRDGAHQRLAAAQREVAETERRLARLQGRERRLCQSYNEEQLTLAEFRQLKAVLQEEADPLRQMIQALQEQIRAMHLTLTHEHRLEARLSELHLWDTLPIPQRKQLLRQFVQQISAAREKDTLHCDVTWFV